MRGTAHRTGESVVSGRGLGPVRLSVAREREAPGDEASSSTSGPARRDLRLVGRDVGGPARLHRARLFRLELTARGAVRPEEIEQGPIARSATVGSVRAPDERLGRRETRVERLRRAPDGAEQPFVARARDERRDARAEGGQLCLLRETHRGDLRTSRSALFRLSPTSLGEIRWHVRHRPRRRSGGRRGWSDATLHGAWTPHFDGRQRGLKSFEPLREFAERFEDRQGPRATLEEYPRRASQLWQALRGAGTCVSPRHRGRLRDGAIQGRRGRVWLSAGVPTAFRGKNRAAAHRRRRWTRGASLR